MDGQNPFQRTAAWMNDRTGCLTASRLCDALDFRKDGTPGAKRIALAKAILAERMTGDIYRNYVTAEMQRGIDEEPASRAAYEAETGNIVQLVGFIPHPELEYAGCSPDGLVDHDGLVELKNPQTATHLDWKMAGVVPEQHKPQLLFQLACTRRRYVDFVSYDSRIRDQRHQLFIRRFEPAAGEIEKIEEQAAEFLRYIDALWETLVGAAA